MRVGVGGQLGSGLATWFGLGSVKVRGFIRVKYRVRIRIRVDPIVLGRSAVAGFSPRSIRVRMPS